MPELIKKILQGRYKKSAENFFFGPEDGYWSHLDKKENELLLRALDEGGPQDAVRTRCPQLFSIIFSCKRQAGLELLDLGGDECAIDYGCMWGSLTIPLAKRCRYVLAVDQTQASLKFLDARLKEEQIANVDLLCDNLKTMKPLDGLFDVALVNGVLEWIPEEGPVELKSYFGKRVIKDYSLNPREQQLNFLKMVRASLKQKGKLYLAIENSLDFKMFFGAKDPHADIAFVSFLPRVLANAIARIKLGRPYVNWLYSFKGIKTLLREAGFREIELYMSFPDYRFPERIIPYAGSLQNFSPTISLANEKGERSWRRFFARAAELLLFKYFRCKYLAPSIIAIGHT